jgi:hypothetical protein
LRLAQYVSGCDSQHQRRCKLQTSKEFRSHRSQK